MENILINVINLIAVLCGVLVISSKNGVHSVLYLVLVFINMGAMLVVYEVEFIGLILVMVYVGAVAVLFLFIVMMVGEDLVRERYNLQKVLLTCYVILCFDRLVKEHPIEVSNLIEVKEELDKVYNMEMIGEVLFTLELINVLVCGFILLVGMIGGVVLGMKK